VISNPHPLPAAPEQLAAVRDLSVLGRVWQRIRDASIAINPYAGGGVAPLVAPAAAGNSG